MMNVLENHIIEVYEVKPVALPPTYQGTAWLSVDVTSICWGSKERKVIYVSADDWDVSLARGYYLA